ncbi:MAG: BatD family protein, partial [Bacteroidia bacterium]
MLVKLRIYKYFSVLTFLLFAISTGFAQEINLNASVSQNTVGLSDAFQFKLEVSGANRSLPEVELPPLNDFRVISGPNQSSQFNMINGRVNVSKTYSVTLLAKKTGKFTIPSVSVKHKGNTYRSEPIVITVVQETPQAQSQNQTESGESQDLFIRAIPSKTKVYVNDQINVSYKVYFRVPIRNPDFIKLPETVGFWVEEYEIAQNIPVTQEVINGQQY